ncbi:MAG: DUF2336 domain-containing protein [Rhodospirillales bacterium]
MAAVASPELQELLRIASDKSAASRTRLTEIVGDLFFDESTRVSDRERSLMVDILRKLIRDVEVQVRHALAERLAAAPEAPPALIRDLANDQIEVAYPILVNSGVLQDEDLIEVVRHRSLEHQLAVSMRSSLSESVADALVETGETDVIKTLLENQGARISERTMAYLVEESKRIDVYQAPLLRRDDLSAALARRMYWWVSAALRQHIVKRYKLDPTELDEHVQETIQTILGDNDLQDAPTRRSTELARRLKETRSITPQLLVQTLRQGEIALFIDLFAALTELGGKLVRRLIFEPGGEGLAIACKGVGIDKAEFASLFLLSRKARPGEKVVDPNELSTVLRLFDRVKPDTAAKVLRHWRLDPDYLEALKRIQGDRPALDNDTLLGKPH